MCVLFLVISAVPEAKALLIAEADFKSLAAGLLFLIIVTLSQSELLCIMMYMKKLKAYPGHAANEVQRQATVGIISNSRIFYPSFFIFFIFRISL